MRYLWLLAWLPAACPAQDGLTGHVVDAATHSGLAYCSVVWKSSRTGTLTNEEGTFALPMASQEDSLVLSMVGYARRTVAMGEVIGTRTWELVSISTELLPVEVRPEQDQLYRLVARCGKALQKMPAFNTKLYFEMGTHMDGRPAEVVECFYNSRVSGPHVETLDLKHGRIGIAPVHGRVFVSLDVTKAMSLLDIRFQDERFPASPFQWTTTGSLGKRYRVEERARANDGSGLVNVRLTPRDSSGRFFALDAWINSTTGVPRSITLSCARCARHPFQPLKPMDHIRSLDMRVAITFDAAPELQHVELTYKMDYEDTVGHHGVSTRAVMHAFDHGKSFILPLFAYDKGQYDYRKITFQPYDTAFWATAPTLVRTEEQERDRVFFAEHGFLTGSARLPELDGQPLFESNYAWWAPDRRISLKTLPPPPALSSRSTSPMRSGAVPASAVNLQAQLYMDVDTTGGQPRIFTATVFDGFRSYYNAPEQRYTDVFLNIYFDLCEIERRHMDQRVRAPGLTYTDMWAMHAQAVHDMERTIRRYLLEVDFGANGPAMTKWNATVKSALGIDNFALFGL